MDAQDIPAGLEKESGVQPPFGGPAKDADILGPVPGEDA